MALVADRIKDSTTTVGTGTITVSGTPPTGFNSFASRYNVGDSVPYAIVGTTGEWETGFGTLVTATTISRDQPTDGSAGLATLVNFSAGTKDVWADNTALLINNNYGIGLAMQMNWLLP